MPEQDYIYIFFSLGTFSLLSISIIKVTEPVVMLVTLYLKKINALYVKLILSTEADIFCWWDTIISSIDQ